MTQGGGMAQVGEMRLGDGTAVRVELEEAHGSGVDLVGRGTDAVRDSAQTLQEALAHIRPALDSVAATVRGLGQRPDTVSVEFGIKMTAEAGVVVAKATSEAHFAVSLQWTGRNPSDRSDDDLSG